jgi:hypothetical protein
VPVVLLRDKLDVTYQEMDNMVGFVTINPRYSPKLVREQSFKRPEDIFKTIVCRPEK